MQIFVKSATNGKKPQGFLHLTYDSNCALSEHNEQLRVKIYPKEHY